MSVTVPAEVVQAEREIEALTARLRPHFRRRAAHRHVGEYVRGLLGPVERKNGWQLAEHAGHRHPRTIQRVLDRSAWDADAVRDDLREQVIAELGDDDGVLFIRPAEAEAVAKAARAKFAAEEATFAAIRARTYDDRWIDEVLRAKGVL